MDESEKARRHEKARAEAILNNLRSGEGEASRTQGGAVLFKLQQAEQALHENEERYRTLLDHLPAIVYRVSYEPHPRMRFFSRAFARLTGYTEEELTGGDVCPLELLMVPEDRPRVVAAMREAVASRSPFSLEYRLRCRDGSIRAFAEFGQPVQGADGTLAYIDGVIFDVTANKQAEGILRRTKSNLESWARERTAELRQSNERLRRENEERLRTEQALRLEEARLDALLRLSQISDAPIEEIAEFILEQGIALTHSEIGFVGFLNEDETVYTLSAVSKQVLEQCRVEGDPMQWNVADAGIWADAIRRRRTLFVNDYSEPHPAKKGLPRGHLAIDRFMVVPLQEGRRIVALAGVGNKSADYDQSDERQITLLLSGMWSYLQRNQAREELREAYSRLEEKVEERTAQLAASTAALRELNQELEQRVSARTAQVQQQADQLRALASELGNAEQRERKRLARVLHDNIQQLLAAARLQVQWLKHETDPERLGATAQGVEGILREAIDACRSLAVDLSPPVLHEAGLSAALSWLATRMRERHQFAVQVLSDSSAEPRSEELRFLLYECARELLFNAVKHSGAAQVEATLMRNADGRIELTVSDQGRGFDGELLQNRRPDEATFGLFSIQQRLAHVGGHMAIETAPGRGTRITLNVPLGEVALAPPGQAEAEDDAERVQTIEVGPRPDLCRVLIVDDHRLMREGLTKLFQFESDIEVVGQAADGPQAVELAERLQPDVVLMDVNLGEMSGIEATEKILARNPGTRVLGLSMHADGQVASAMRTAGAIGYLTKDGPAEDLIAAVRACRR